MSWVRAHIAAMQGYIPGEQPPLGKYIKLNTNENPYPASKSVAIAIQEAIQHLARYPDPMATAMRKQVAAMTGYSHDQVLCGNGSDDLLTILVRTFVGEGESLRTLAPSYILYQTLAQLQGAACEMIPYTKTWGLPPEFLVPSTRLKLAVIANPNSPSGTCIASETLLEVAEKLPCPLVIDEAYVDFADRHCMELVGKSAKILVMRSLSKAYSLAGLRCGYIVGAPELIAQMIKMKDSYNCGMLSIAGGTAALADEAWLNEHVAKIRGTRERAAARLAKLGFCVTPSQANFLWCTRDPRSELPELEKIFLELKRQQILVRFMQYRDWGEGLRISIGTDDQMDVCLNRLESILHARE
jgi:histidinol-phosphate aminotransferase